MGPDYVGSHLRRTCTEAGHLIDDWEILDLDVVQPTQREQRLRDKLRGARYAFVGLSYLSFQADEAMAIVSFCADELDRIGCRKGFGPQAKEYTPIICGGRGVTDADEYADLYPDVDFFVAGQSFHQPLDSIVHIARLIAEGRAADFEARKKLPGIVSFDQASGRLVCNPAHRKPEYPIDFYFNNLERKSHHPKYDFDVFYDAVDGRPRKTAQVYTQQGCGHFCSFCFESLRPEPSEERGIESVVREVEALVKSGYEGIYFDDSIFTQDRPRTLRLMKIMGRLHQRFGTVWGFNTRIDALDEGIIDAAAENGCVYNFAGVESLVPEVIEGMNKLSGGRNPHYPPVENGVDYVRRAKEVFLIMKAKGLPSAVFLIFGAPKRVEGGRILAASIDDDKRSISESIWGLRPQYLSFNIMRFIPDAAISRIPLYREYRGGQDFRGGFYYGKYRAAKGLKIPTTSHPIYEAFESAGGRYPIPSNMTPEACYNLLKFMVEQVNEYYRVSGERIVIKTDENFAKRYLARETNGYYQLTEFEKII